VDPRFDAGFTGARISAGIAEAAGIPVVLHSYGELGVAFAGCLHLAASCPNFSLANQGTSYRLLTDDVIAGGPLRFDVSRMALPIGPGIGVQLDEDRVAAYEE
jgi:glucarate dehydratase